MLIAQQGYLVQIYIIVVSIFCFGIFFCLVDKDKIKAEQKNISIPN